jgi:hypothetical protein
VVAHLGAQAGGVLGVEPGGLTARNSHAEVEGAALRLVVSEFAAEGGGAHGSGRGRTRGDGAAERAAQGLKCSRKADLFGKRQQFRLLDRVHFLLIRGPRKVFGGEQTLKREAYNLRRVQLMANLGALGAPEGFDVAIE